MINKVLQANLIIILIMMIIHHVIGNSVKEVINSLKKHQTNISTSFQTIK